MEYRTILSTLVVLRVEYSMRTGSMLWLIFVHSKYNCCWWPVDRGAWASVVIVLTFSPEFSVLKLRELTCWSHWLSNGTQIRFLCTRSYNPLTVHKPSSWLILGLLPVNEKRRYKVTPSLIGWSQTQNQPCLFPPLTWGLALSSAMLIGPLPTPTSRNRWAVRTTGSAQAACNRPYCNGIRHITVMS